MCNVFKIAFGKIPNNTVGINKDINKKNSLLLISFNIFKLVE